MINDPITTIEAAAILGIDPSAIRHRIMAQTLQAEKRGRDLYVSAKVIKAEANRKNGKRKSRARINGKSKK